MVHLATVQVIEIPRQSLLRVICWMFTSTDDVVVEPHMELLSVMRCTLRELKALKEVELAVTTYGVKVFLAVRAAAAWKQQPAGATRHKFTTIGAWLVRVSEHKVSRHLLHGSRWLLLGN